MTRYIKNLDPATITTRKPKLPGMVNPKPEHLAAAGWRTVETIPIPEGYTAEGATYTAHPDRDDICIETETGRLTAKIYIEQQAQAATEAESARDAVQALQNILAAFGLTIDMPGGYGEARRILTGMQARNEIPPEHAGMLALLAEAHRNALEACGGSGSAIVDVWRAMNQ